MRHADVTSRAEATPIPEGMDVRDYVDQGTLWATHDGMIPVRKMAHDHRRVSARWMLDNATGLILMYESGVNEDIRAGVENVTLADVLKLMAFKPKEWVAQTALYRALTA